MSFSPFSSPRRHALDIREHYERKLERANNLYMELNAIMLQLEIKEKELLKYENRRWFTAPIKSIKSLGSFCVVLFYDIESKAI